MVFPFKRGAVASLALLAVIHVYLVISGRFVLSLSEVILLHCCNPQRGSLTCFINRNYIEQK
jgi:hypothetical protein